LNGEFKMKDRVSAPNELTRERAEFKRSDNSILRARRLPIGAEPVSSGGSHFRVWAPESPFVKVELLSKTSAQPEQEIELEAEENGYFSGHVAGASTGMLYRYKLKSGPFPDPASRFQPEGPHGFSEIIDPLQFRWTDHDWKGSARRGQVIYEMHVGTFTRAGTWSAAREELAELANLGITVIEVMPVAEFPGRFGWGYDGVDLFAPTRLYGRPDDFRSFVDHAHAVGIGVILDVVYNHFGPDGNYLKQFSKHYFTDRYSNEWGDPINFDGEQCQQVREFFCANAGYWIEEFHLDGLRLDATQQIFDTSGDNILAAIGRHVRQAGHGKATFLVAENERQNSTLVRGPEQRGYALDALWNDDFHHAAMVALSGRAEAYYSDYRGTAQEFVSAIKWGFLYQGQRSNWQSNARGTTCLDLEPDQFINYLQNHDQVANSLFGLRAHQLGSIQQLRALTALLLLGPATPMLFQGQEFGASTPFHFFADHHPELAQLVQTGRRNFLNQFSTIAAGESQSFFIPPESIETFERSKLDLSERRKNSALYELHRDLLRLRREDPTFSQPRRQGVDGAVLEREAFVLRFFGHAEHDRLLLVNLGSDLLYNPAPEPLLASIPGFEWDLIWSSESPRYGGTGTFPIQTGEGWRIPGHAAVVFAPKKSTRKS
jgi:maltooligosyltrehalose trehalohydrolase